jgi:hypothetical protein
MLSQCLMNSITSTIYYYISHPLNFLDKPPVRCFTHNTAFGVHKVNIWAMKLYSLEDKEQLYEETCCLYPLSRRWKHYVPLKHSEMSSRIQATIY